MDEHTSREGSIGAAEDAPRNESILYPVHTAPNPLLWPLFALQYLILTIPGILASTVLLADQLDVADMPQVRSELFSLGLFTSGVATVIQILLGCRLPTLEGPNPVYIVAIAAIVQSSQWEEGKSPNGVQTNITSVTDEPWRQKMSELQGNLLLASVTHFLLGVTGITGFLLRFIGPVTLAPTIMLVGISISGYMIPLCEQHWGIAILSVALVVIFSLMLAKVTVPLPFYTGQKTLSVVRYPLFRLNAVMLAVGLSWLLSYILTVTDTLPSNSTMYGHMARTDVRNSVLNTAPWFYLPRPFSFGMPTFSVSGYIAMLTVNMITIMELIGGYFAIARVTDSVPPPVHAVNRGIGVNGLSCLICSVFCNPCGNVPYLQLLGCIAVTKIASRAVFMTTACMLIFGGVVGKIGAVLTLIPDPVIGGVNLIALGMLAAVGVTLLHHIDLASTRNLMIIGMCLVFGLKIPEWMERNQGIIQTGNGELDQVLTVLLSTPMCVTGLLGCLLDNIAAGTEEERGISKWRQSTEGSTGTYTTTAEIYKFPWLSEIIAKVKCCIYCPISPTFENDSRCTSCRKEPTSAMTSYQNQGTADESRD